MTTTLRCAKGCLLATVDGDEITTRYRLDSGKTHTETHLRVDVEEVPVRARCKHQAHDFFPSVFELPPGKRLLQVDDYSPCDQIGRTVTMAEVKAMAEEMASQVDFEGVLAGLKNLGVDER